MGILNEAQARTLLSGELPEESVKVVRIEGDTATHKYMGQHEPANAIIARFNKAMDEEQEWVDNCPAVVVYGD